MSRYACVLFEYEHLFSGAREERCQPRTSDSATNYRHVIRISHASPPLPSREWYGCRALSRHSHRILAGAGAYASAVPRCILAPIAQAEAIDEDPAKHDRRAGIVRGRRRDYGGSIAICVGNSGFVGEPIRKPIPVSLSIASSCIANLHAGHSANPAGNLGAAVPLIASLPSGLAGPG